MVGEDPADTSMELTADASSLRVVEGTGGMQALGDEDMANIHQTIDDEVLMRRGHQRSARPGCEAEPDGSRIHAEGDLTLVGETRPIAFDLVDRRRRRRSAPPPSSSRPPGA